MHEVSLNTSTAISRIIYVVQMLDLLLLSDEGGPRHMVAYGGPVRQWVKTHFIIQDYFGVNSIAKNYC